MVDRSETLTISHQMKDGREDYIDQDPSFTNRVKLQGPRLLNMTLRNVTTKDSGTYVCVTRSKNSAGIHKIHVHFVHLTVEQDMTVILICYFFVGILLVGSVIVIATLVYKCKEKSKKSQMDSLHQYRRGVPFKMTVT